MAAVTLEDYIKPIYRKCMKSEISPTKSTSIAKVLAFMFGTISIGLAFLAQLLGGVLQVSRKKSWNYKKNFLINHCDKSKSFIINV